MKVTEQENKFLEIIETYKEQGRKEVLADLIANRKKMITFLKEMDSAEFDRAETIVLESSLACESSFLDMIQLQKMIMQDEETKFSIEELDDNRAIIWDKATGTGLQFQKGEPGQRDKMEIYPNNLGLLEPGEGKEIFYSACRRLEQYAEKMYPYEFEPMKTK